MNERIKQLWEEAAKTTQSDSWEEQTAFMSRFAELIIRRCAGVCEDYRGTEWGKAAECIGDSIKEHFGVEQHD